MPIPSECPSISSSQTGPCLLCGRCLEVCPVFRATCREELSPRGKAFLLDQSRHMDLNDLAVSRLAELCTGCGRCTRICPQNIDLPGEISRLKSRHDRFRAWIWSRIVSAGLRLPPYLRPLRHCLPAGPSFVRTAISAETGISPVLRLTSDLPLSKTRAAVFSGCVGGHVRPGLKQKAGQILKMAGYQVLDQPSWHCCGYPFRSSGLPELQLREIQANLRIWLNAGRPLIFCFCATCAQALKNIPDLLPENPLAREMADNIFPLDSVLKSLKACAVQNPGLDRVIWHEPCHGPWDSAGNLSRLLTGAGLSPPAEVRECCGMGGTLALQHPGLSSSIARNFWAGLPRNAGTMLVTDCGGCLLQLQSTAPGSVSTGHWLDLLIIHEPACHLASRD